MSQSSSLTAEMLQAIEAHLQAQLAEHEQGAYEGLFAMLRYHMGWGPGAARRGKRLRPLLTLLACKAVHAPWEPAVPAACAVEWVHNFSLIHDDIQDQSETRRAHETVWKRWGIAQAINAGDALFALAQLAAAEGGGEKNLSGEVSLVLNRACLELTKGQHLDLAFESRSEIAVEDYLRMIAGKTAALLSAACEIGALMGGASEMLRRRLVAFGRELGLAFQIHDDWLGIWGDPSKTGKSTADDLRSGKKSLPILYALSCCDEFLDLWSSDARDRQWVERAIDSLERCGARSFTEERFRAHSEHARRQLEAAGLEPVASEALHDLIARLQVRQG